MRLPKTLDGLRNNAVLMQTLADQIHLQSRQFSGGMPLNQLAIFFEVATAQSLGSYTSATEIRESLELDRRAVSRYLLSLSDAGYGGDIGMDLIEFFKDTSDQRVKRIGLTRKGEELALRLAHQLQEQAIIHMDLIETAAEKNLDDCHFMLGVDTRQELNVFLVRTGYVYGMYARMRRHMFADVPSYSPLNRDLVVLESKLDLTQKEINKTLSNLKYLKISKPSPIIVWLASDDNPKSLANILNRIVKDSGHSKAISFHNQRSLALGKAKIGTEWTYPELRAYP